MTDFELKRLARLLAKLSIDLPEAFSDLYRIMPGWERHWKQHRVQEDSRFSDIVIRLEAYAQAHEARLKREENNDHDSN